jgi:putative ABC transport system permease protein
VVTLSGAVFGGVVVRTLADGQQAAADSIGADAVVTSPDITPPALAALRRAPGVQSVLGELAVPRTAVDDSDGTGHQIILIGVDPGLVPGVPTAPAGLLGGAPIPVLGSPSLVRDLPGLAFTADMASITRDFEVVATMPGSSDAAALPEILRPAFRGYTGAFVVLPIDELSLLAGGRDATTAVITGNTVTSSALRAALIGKMSPATDIAVRSETLTRLRSDGLARSLTVLFQVCSALSAAFAVLIVVLELAATARERGRTVSFLRTMGLPSRTAGALTVFQLIPTLVAALVAGTALGVALPRLLGPALDLTVFTDGHDAPTRTDVRVTLLLGAALIGVVAVAAAVEAPLGRRRRISGVLRLGDE